MFSAFVVPSIGQVFWADSVLDYSSRYSPEESSELQILGKPNAMPQGGDLATAWKPDLENDGFQHIRVSFEKPVDAYQVFIAENYNPGSIASIEMFDSDFRLIHKVSEIPEPFEKPTRMYNNYFGGIVKGVKYLRLLLSTEVVEGYNAIDAIGLSEDKMPYLTQIEEYGGSLFKDDPINLGSNVNTVNSDRFPVISPDEKTLYFCRTGDTNNYGSYYNTDIYISKVDENGNFGKAYNAGKPLNNGYSNFVTSAMPDGNTIVLGTAYQSDSISYQGISLSRKIGENWSPPSNIVIDKIGRTGDYNEYYLTADGLHLLMGISRIDSYGKNDLYISRRINDTLFSEPVNLGPDINTAEYEAYPFLASDGRTLYFCSSGFPGYGERDIYISRRIGEGWDKWSEPRNLGPKINTNKFEGNISIPASGEYAYFVSSIYGYGQEDIFKIKLPQAYKPEPIMLVSGIVRDQETNTPIGAEIVYEDIYTGEMLGKAYSNQKTGAYSISLPSGNRYSFSARSQGYYGIQENINLKQISNFDTTYKDLSLAPIKKDYAIRLNNIFFDSGEHELLPGSMTELSQLARYLSDKDFRIRIEGHTDNIGTIRDNQVLSEKRAKAVYNFLISVGIPARYLTTKGFGESQPLSDADTDEARKLNRRVEFRVLKGLDN
jgi:outer membrane protein OmpA-like peptidoglycan-associated protein